MKHKRLLAIGAAAILVAAVPVGAVAGPARAADPAIHIVASGVALDASGPHKVISTLARNAAGDLYVFFNNQSDGVANTLVYVTRSTDDGATWSAPTVFFTPPSGSVASPGDATTLSNGTLIVPINVQTIVNHYLDRPNSIYLDTSTDGGLTWSQPSATPPTGSPIVIGPTGWYGAIQYGEMLQLSSGELVMPIWGSPLPPSSTNYSTLNPAPLASGVVRSSDLGATWGSFAPFDGDFDSPMRSVASNQWVPAAYNEATIAQLRDGRLMALVRYDSRNAMRAAYVTYSDDQGDSWSEPRPAGVSERGGALFTASCSSGLAGYATKLLYATTSSDNSEIDVRTTYDAGVTFGNTTPLVIPAGSGITSPAPLYADAVHLDNGNLFVTFTSNNQLLYNVIDESDSTECSSELATSKTAAATSIQLYVDRADGADWDPIYGHKRVAVSPTTTMASLRATALSASSASTGTIHLTKNGTPLPLNGTVADAGLVSGDAITVSAGTPRPDPALRVGLIDYDTRPLTRKATNFDDELQMNAGWDVRNRSLVVDHALEPGQHISSITMTDNNTSNSITSSNVAVYASADGATWAPVSFTLSDPPGQSQVAFTNIAAPAGDEYVKVNFLNAGGTYTLVTQTYAGVTVTVAP